MIVIAAAGVARIATIEPFGSVEPYRKFGTTTGQ
jgi:hypothetical protein